VPYDPVIAEDRVPFTIPAVVAWAVTVGTAIAVVVQRWDQPHLARNAALVAVSVLVLALDDLAHVRGWRVAHMPELVWCMPTIVTVLVLVWTPTAIDFAPFLLVLVTARAVLYGSVVDGLLVWAASAGVMILVELTDHFEGSLIWILGISFGWLGGYATRSMLRVLDELRAAQAGLAERAAADERQRIAREIHDVIAHSLSVTALHITGARMAVRRDPEEAEEALTQAERLTRDSLAQVRSVIGVLESSTAGTAPALPSATDIPVLVEEFRSAGVRVTLNVTGDLGAVSPTIGLALYRVAQESLSNVVRHAPGTEVRVEVCTAPDIALTVRNPIVNGAAQRGEGRGLRGMHERAVAEGGTLDAGPHDGAWQVRLNIPSDAA
jgi:signal transduction histidine kinase